MQQQSSRSSNISPWKSRPLAKESFRVVWDNAIIMVMRRPSRTIVQIPFRAVLHVICYLYLGRFMV